MIDLGLGYFDENIQITELASRGVDLNFHWFATSHVEAIFTGRFEMLAFGNGRPQRRLRARAAALPAVAGRRDTNGHARSGARRDPCSWLR